MGLGKKLPGKRRHTPRTSPEKLTSGGLVEEQLQKKSKRRVPCYGLEKLDKMKTKTFPFDLAT